MQIYVSIGNSDDKLTQAEWSEYVHEVESTLCAHSSRTYGSWLSRPDAPFQNACWSVELDEAKAERVRRDLPFTARRFRQDSIAWSVATTEFIEA